MLKLTTILGLAGTLLPVAGLHASGTYYNLGASRNASGVSADGTLAVGTTTPGQPYFIWQLSNPTTTTLIGGITAGNGVGGRANVSDNGDKICGTIAGFVGAPPIPATVVHQMAMYDVSDGTWTGVGGIGWFSGTETASGWSVSGDGTTLVGLGWSPNQTNAYAIVSANGAAPTALPWLIPGRSTRANGCDADGSVVVGWQDRPDGFRCAAVWTNGVGQRIWRTYPRQPCGEAQACSADGNWVVGNGNAISTDGQAWRWSQSTGVQLLGDADANPATVGLANAITPDGSIIVGFEGTGLNRRAFVWTQANGIQDLTNYVVAQGVTLGTTVLGVVTDVSDDGLTFVGTTTANTGYVIRLDPPPPPPDACDGDVSADGLVDITDLLAVIAAWGQCPAPDHCPADTNNDAHVDITDLLLVVGAWGDCP